jgi:K+-transporting ATPase ATPase A chain
MSHFTQMVGLATQNFVSAAVGIAVAIALIRGLTRRRSATIGNFWVDLTKATLRILLPIAFVAAIVLVSQGVVQNLNGNTAVKTVQGVTQHIPGGPIASQEAIKELGTNGGGPYNANSAHPFESPNGFTTFFQIFLLLVIPFSLTYTFGKLVKDTKQGWAVFAAMFVLWIAAAGIAMGFEAAGNPELNQVGVTQAATSQQSGGNFEGKEVRFGSAACGLFAASTTGTSTGSVNCMHDSMTPAGGGTALLNIMFGEVSPGGVGAGLYGILVFALLSVFIAGLMVGRTPEYLGKKIQAAEMKLVVLYLLAVPFVILGFTATSVLLDTAKASILNPGAHGLSEITYAFTSAANNNGSAFGGLTGNTDWYNTTLGLSMLIGRFLLIVPVLAVAGSLARKQPAPPSAGTFPTNTPLFTVLLVGVIVLVVGLTFFPVLALGPIAEQLGL